MKNSLISDDDRQMAIEFLLSVVRDKSVKTSDRIKAAKVLLKIDPVIAVQSAGLN
jgi:hypothetical protein